MLHTLHPWVYHGVHPSVLSMTANDGCRRWTVEEALGSRKEDSPGWGLSPWLKSSKVWRMEGDMMRKVLRSPRVKDVKDWMWQGSIPYISLWCRHVAQRGTFRPSIRSWENVHVCLPVVAQLYAEVTDQAAIARGLNIRWQHWYSRPTSDSRDTTRDVQNGKVGFGNQHRRRATITKPAYKPRGFFTFRTVLIRVFHPFSHFGTGITLSITLTTTGYTRLFRTFLHILDLPVIIGN